MRSYNHIAGINILGDCMPHASNFMELSDEKDARGLPKPPPALHGPGKTSSA